MQPTSHSLPLAPPKVSKRLFASSYIGSFIEWYDFLVYGIVAVLAFSHVFFPKSDPFIGTLAALTTFAVGFVSRPLGGIIFGHFGDRIGRRTVLVITLIIMGVATVGIGVLPGYDSIGIWAPILLTVLRFAQGLALGGEWGGGALMVAEASTDGNRGRIGSWFQSSGYIGTLAGTVVVAVVTALTTAEQFLQWGWRIPFLISVILVFLGLWIRKHLEETQEFKKVKTQNERERIPLIAVWRESKKKVFGVTAIHSAQTALLFVGFTFLPTHMGAAGFAKSEISAVGVIFLVGATIACFLSGAAADRFGRRPPVFTGLILSILVAFPLFWAVATHSAIVVGVVLFIAGLAIGSIYGPEAAYFSELFPSKHRYTGISFGVQTATMIAGATGPILATLFLEATHGATWTIAALIIFWQLVGITGALVAGDTYVPRSKVMATPETAQLVDPENKERVTALD